MLKNETLMFDI